MDSSDVFEIVQIIATVSSNDVNAVFQRLPTAIFVLGGNYSISAGACYETKYFNHYQLATVET